MTRLAGDARVHTLVTLGTPHSGSYAAYIAPTRLMRQMRPGSGLMHELAQRVHGCRTRFITYWSDNDMAILPHESAALRHPDLGARNVRLPEPGTSRSPCCARSCTASPRPWPTFDTDGTTVTSGVTPLARDE